MEVRVEAPHIIEDCTNLVLLHIMDVSWELVLYTMAVVVVEVVCAMVAVEEVEVEVEGPAECCWCTVRRLFEFTDICSIKSSEKYMSSPCQYDFHQVLRVGVSPASKHPLLQSYTRY